MKKRTIYFNRFKRIIRDNKNFIIVWGLALLTVVLVNMSTKNSYNFVGVTESKEVNINLKHAVIVKSINVIPGQRVKKGQLLIELERPDLEKLLNEASLKLDMLKNEYTTNEQLTAQLKSIKKEKKEIENPITIEMKSLQNKIRILRKEHNELFIFASFDGHVGSVNYKKGESVSPFTSVLTIHNATPTFVRGYIHENIFNKVIVDSKVNITTLVSNKKIQAKVTNVGTRIIEFPERFRRSNDEKVWGREVMIRLPDNNGFLLGEKVFLEMDDEKIEGLKRGIADGVVEKEEYLREIVVPKSILKKNHIEPSGIVYIKDLNKYLVISDDTKNNKPYIYLMDLDGRINKNIIEISGVDKINDMESITLDEEGFIYIASSLSKNKRGKIGKSRRRILKIKRDGLELSVVNNIDLLSAIEDNLKDFDNMELGSLLLHKNKVKLNIEGLAIKDNILYLGMRNSTGANNEVAILKIDKLNTFINSGKLTNNQLTLWNLLELPAKDEMDLDEGISDLMIDQNNLFIVTASNKITDKGRLFKLDLSTNRIENIKNFERHRPEGIAYNSELNELTVVFDKNSGKKAFMTRIAN